MVQIFAKLIFVILMGTGITSSAYSQVFLQLELANEVKTIKYFPGDQIEIKTTQIDEWEKRTINLLVVDGATVVFTDGIVNLSDITHVKLIQPSANAFGHIFEKFGLAWLFFGGVASLASDQFSMSLGQAIFGVAATGTGYFLRKVAAVKKYEIGNRNRLRILDISFPETQPDIIKP